MATKLERIQERLNKIDSEKGGLWKPKAGKNTIRILPSLNEEKDFYKDTPTHFSVGPNNRAVICPKAWDKPCPICRKAEKLSNSDDAKKQAKAEKLQPRTLVVMNILDVTSGEKVLQWSASESQLRQLLAFFVDSDYGDLTDPKEGFDVNITKSGEGKGTKYEIRPTRNPSAVKNWKEIKKTLPDLDEKYKPYSKERIEAIMEGRDDQNL